MDSNPQMINGNFTAISPSPNTSPPCALKAATPIAITNGIIAKRVNSPAIKSSEQKNSANITRAKEIFGPRYKKSINFFYIKHFF